MANAPVTLRIDLGGPALEFVKLPDPSYSARYTAEIDGVRVPIKLHRTYTDTGYSSRGTHTDDEHGMEILLWDLDDVAGVAPTRDGDAWVFAIDIERHYRSYKRGRVRVAYVDGVVHWDAEIEEQDDSYY